jgi:outer membrane protein OmpA-like peptidoglycan-associated protein
VKRLLLLLIGLGIIASPGLTQAGVFVAPGKELVDPSKGEHPSVTLSFDERYGPVVVTVVADEGGEFSKTWSWKSVVVGRDYAVHWKQPPGEVEYSLTVEMKSRGGEVFNEEVYFYVASAEPLQASIPPESVDLKTNSFDLVSNHGVVRVELEVMDDNRRMIGKSTFAVPEAELGTRTRVTWEQSTEGNIFRIDAKAYDAYGYWAGVEIIPWTLQIPHEDVVFASGSHELVAEELPKLEPAWRQIVKAVKKYGEWVQCSLYIAGYTDTVGDRSSNQALSQRRALTLASYFKDQGATFPMFYRGYGEAVLAVPTEDNVAAEPNRRAVYVITAGPAPLGRDTPGGSWKRLR